MKEEQTFNFTLTKTQMRVIVRALEAFERAQMGQFKIAFEQIFEYESDEEYRKKLKHLDWDEYSALEQMVKTSIFNRESNIHSNHSSLGIAGVSESGKIAYEIEKVITQFLIVENNDGYWTDSYRSYDDPLKLSQEPLPVVKEFKKYKDYPIPKKHWKKLRELFKENNMKSMWEIVDQYIPKDVSSSNIEVYPFSNKLAHKDINGNYFEDICIRMWKPKKKDEFEGNSHE